MRLQPELNARCWGLLLLAALACPARRRTRGQGGQRTGRAEAGARGGRGGPQRLCRRPDHAHRRRGRGRLCQRRRAGHRRPAVKGDALLGGWLGGHSCGGGRRRARRWAETFASRAASAASLFAAGANVTLAQGSQVDQGSTLFAGTTTLDGKVVGPIKVRAQKIVINGEVTGDADLVGEQIDLGRPRASAATWSTPRAVSTGPMARASAARPGKTPAAPTAATATANDAGATTPPGRAHRGSPAC